MPHRVIWHAGIADDDRTPMKLIRVPMQLDALKAVAISAFGIMRETPSAIAEECLCTAPSHYSTPLADDDHNCRVITLCVHMQLDALKAVAMSAFGIMRETAAKIHDDSRRAIASINKDLKEVTAEYDTLR
jgi:hypothetical protein